MNNQVRKRKKATISASPNPESLTSDITPSEDPASAIIDVSAVEVPELTEQEQSDRLHLELKVERAFFEAGKALAELRDRRLYRSTHRTFEEYCRDRFGFERRHPYRLIEAAVVVDNLMQMCPIGTRTEADSSDEQEQSGTQAEIESSEQQMCPFGTQIMPTSERQVRPLTKLEPQQQQEVWQRAVQVAGGKVPSARIVTDVVQKIMERTKVPNSYQVGEVCQILVKDNPDLRGKGGCWCIVTYVREFSCTVRTWDGELTIGVQHLRSFNYLSDECQQMQEICNRINRVYSSGLEESVQRFLESLGKLKRSYLTGLEEKVLSLLELETGG
ncbi:hypothetical protein IQ244_26215 [Nostoc sp. LEGE 06077]|uniref:hypothetical protein n=1 Tax=Nostoc sp. LEGE 06077 TaxID=915325 RepID=UPI0018812DC5|nr:hypothetical protein [Nostoc sp. LEGE 06077]MBE9209926.1 hypothetical protein [Nostoc sp. LEGE 06077]